MSVYLFVFRGLHKAVVAGSDDTFCIGYCMIVMFVYLCVFSSWPRGSHKAGVAESDDTFSIGYCMIVMFVYLFVYSSWPGGSHKAGVAGSDYTLSISYCMIVICWFICLCPVTGPGVHIRLVWLSQMIRSLRDSSQT